MRTIVLSFSITDSSVTDYFISLANQLAKSGMRVIVLADRMEEHHFTIDPSVKIFRWPSPRPTKLKDLLFAVKIFLRYRPETVLAIFSSVNICMVAGWLMRVRNRIAWSRTVSTAFHNTASLNRRKVLIYKLATKVFANSETTCRDLTDNFGVPRNKVRIFPNALSEPRINEAKEPKRIQYVGRLLPEKGVDLLIEALPEIVRHQSDVVLEIIGGRVGMGRTKHYAEIAERLGVLDNVSFLGELPNSQVLKRLAGAACTVMPSFAEGFGWVIIESFSVGTPVVGTNATAIPEIIRDGQDGFLFRKGDKSDLAKKVIQMLSDADLRGRMSDSCKDHFRANFDTRVVIPQVAAYLMADCADS